MTVAFRNAVAGCEMLTNAAAVAVGQKAAEKKNAMVQQKSRASYMRLTAASGLVPDDFGHIGLSQMRNSVGCDKGGIHSPIDSDGVSSAEAGVSP